MRPRIYPEICQIFADAERLTRHTDGFIVGSALIREAARLWDDRDLTDSARRERVGEWARTLKTGDAPTS